jgi:hypothetical protein
MSGLADNFLRDLLLRQPFLGPEREDSDNGLIAPPSYHSSELDVGWFAVIVGLCLVKSKGHRSPAN